MNNLILLHSYILRYIKHAKLTLTHKFYFENFNIKPYVINNNRIIKFMMYVRNFSKKKKTIKNVNLQVSMYIYCTHFSKDNEIFT